MLTRLTIIISYYVPISNHFAVYLKLIMLCDNYILIIHISVSGGKKKICVGITSSLKYLELGGRVLGGELRAGKPVAHIMKTLGFCIVP